MMTFYRRHTASSFLNGAALVFVLLLQSVHSYVPIDDEKANIDILIQSGGGDAKIGGGNDTEFPGRKLDTKKVKRRLDQYDRQILLYEHNTHRRTTQPLASDMVFMVWSLSLQREAKTVAESCNETYELSKDGQALMEQWFSNVGINTWMESAMFKFVVGNAVHKWTEEKSFYNFGRNTCQLGKECSQYIQVIWSTASHLGCELHFCDIFHTTSRMDRHNLYYVACVYGEGKTRQDTAGTYLKPFTNGTHCHNCPTGFAECSKGLCQTQPPCETVVDCTEITDTEYCLCDKSTYDRSHRLTTFPKTWMGIWFTGAILSSFLVS